MPQEVKVIEHGRSLIVAREPVGDVHGHAGRGLGLCWTPRAIAERVHLSFRQADFDRKLSELAEFLRELHRGEFLRWAATGENLLVNGWRNRLRDWDLLNTGAAIATWFVAPIQTGATIAGADTYQSHAGWTEDTGYDEATRPAFVGAAGGVGQVTNSASPASFTINATGGSPRDLHGFALVSENVKGASGAGPELRNALAFDGGDRQVKTADTLEITYDSTHTA